MNKNCLLFLLFIAALASAPLTLFAQKSAEKTKKKPVVVRTGVYLMNLYDLNMNGHSFYADFYIWFKWRGNFDPTGIEFVNSIEKWSASVAASGDSSTVILKDSTKYKIFRVEGRFFHAFSLKQYPLDQHTLDIQIENPDADADSILYVPDTSGVAVRPTLGIVGWETTPAKLETGLHDYKSNFGNPQENACRYSKLTFTMTLRRPFSFFLLKMLLPLAVVMLVSIGALLLHPSHIDTRSSLPIGGLLTAVFLQQQYSDALPDTGYMVLMDKIYLLAYILISLVLLQVIVGGNLIARGGTETEIAQTDRREAWQALAYFLIFAIGVAVLC